MEPGAIHGGEFFHAVGEDFAHLDRLRQVVSADVLDAWFDPSPKVLARLREYLPDLLRTSPPLDAGGLVQTIAQVRGVPAQSVLAGAGSSDLIFTCLPRMIAAGSTVLLTDPVYGEYPYIFEKVIRADVRRHALLAETGFRIDRDSLLAGVRKHRADVVAIVNPNSPTGLLWPKAELLEFLRALPPATRLFVDETYVDYAGAEHSVERHVAEYPNLVVIKSMSKCYALSGLRVAYMVAAPSVVDELRPLMPPWAISLIAQVGGVEALKDFSYYAARYAETRRFREELASELARIEGLLVYPSDANFLLVESSACPVSGLLERTRAEGVFLRECATISPRLAAFFRVAVKDPERNNRIVQAIRHALRDC